MTFHHVSAKRLILDELLLILIAALTVFVFLLLIDANSALLHFLLVLLGVLVFLIGIVYLPLLWYFTGWRLTSHKLYVKKGVFFFRWYELPLQQIVNIVLLQHPFTPILQTAAVVVCCPGAMVRLHGISLSDAKWLIKTISLHNEM